jgi:para-nitrobenzyl esterase
MPTGANNGVIDGRVLLEAPYEAMRKGRGRNVALLMGYNREEMALFGPPPDPASFNPEAKAAFEKYRTLNPGVPDAELAGRAAAERTFGGPAFIYADNHAAAGGTSYVYRWDWAAETGKFKGSAIHGIETPFVWDNIDSLAFRYIVPDRKLRPRASAAHRLWVSFIRDGKPTAAGVPEWPRWTPTDRRYLVIADDFRVDRLPSDAMTLWSGLLGA